ncbi:MAG: GspH/FimT family pseudopilin [Proteobacteria bacterium]|nr:GspH/FimT family pseudopilin [Pseudomonadota bacterium]
MGARGFTLIEIMVVMAILALMLVLISPNFSTALPGVSLKAAARTLAGSLRHARSRAIALNEEVALAIDVETRRYAIVGGKTSGKLPGKGEIRLFTAQSELIDATSGTIRFFPDGGSTGGGVTFIDGERRYRVLVDWLTGQTSIHD